MLVVIGESQDERNLRNNNQLLRVQLAAVRNDNAGLRRQLAEAKTELEEILSALVAETKDALPLEDWQKTLHEISAPIERSEAEAADLRRQLAECQEELTAVPLEDINRHYATNLYPDGLPISDGPKWPWSSPPVSEDDHALVCAERDKLRQQLKEAKDGVAMNAKLYHAASQERDDYRARFRDLERELEIMRSQLMAMQERAEKAEAQLAAVPVDAMLECIAPDGYDFTAPTLMVLRFANWLEAERSACA